MDRTTSCACLQLLATLLPSESATSCWRWQPFEVHSVPEVSKRPHVLAPSRFRLI
jgi:hypothetical protein